MPMPVSQTDNLVCGPDPGAGERPTVPPGGVNLTAFEIRFQSTCCSRSGSPARRQRRRREVPFDRDPAGLGGRSNRFNRRRRKPRSDRHS